MSIDPVSSTPSAFPPAIPEKKTYAQEVVEQAQKALNGPGPEAGFASAGAQGITDKASFGAAVVTKTLDYLNSGHSADSAMAQSYDFQKTVLGGHAEALTARAMGQGGLTDIKI